jgi:hypothetical protein
VSARTRTRIERAAGALLLAATVAAGGLATTPRALAAQDATDARAIGDRVARVGNGTVRFSFAAREGVCGNGRNVSIRSSRAVSRDVEWESDCEPGPVRVALAVRDGQVVEVRSHVGGRWRADAPAATELGTVPASAARAYLLDLAARAAVGPARDAIFPAMIAEGPDVWPTLLRLARDEGRPGAVRQQAVFWVGQAAGEAASRGLNELVDEHDADIEVREHAVFALSQRPADEAVPALIRVARTSPSPRLRQRAIFWLGQSKDARALAYFEEVLGKG